MILPWDNNSSETLTSVSQLLKADPRFRYMLRRQKINETAAKRCVGVAPVKSLDQLMRLALEKRSVFCRNMWGLLPATVVLNMQARTVHSILKRRLMVAYPKS